jgi:uncharacterized integral membrane protein
LVTLRRLSWAAALVLLVLIGAVFAYSNPEPIDVDIGLARFEGVAPTAVFGVVLALGWLLGLLTAAAALWRSRVEKRRLRHDLEHAHAELHTRRETS